MGGEIYPKGRGQNGPVRKPRVGQGRPPKGRRT